MEMLMGEALNNPASLNERNNNPQNGHIILLIEIDIDDNDIGWCTLLLQLLDYNKMTVCCI
uniref:Uncharacterized protein n=1 Tax=Arion vulgaris TaxID=1028688 RepID=A0A0B6ZTC3_9EUPU